jgi:hypothetical protein
MKIMMTAVVLAAVCLAWLLLLAAWLDLWEG